MTDTLQDEAAKLVAWLHDEQAAMMGAAGADFSEEPLVIYGRCENVLRDMSAAFDALEAERDRLREWNAAMVAKAASGGVLDGYRAMGAKLARYEGALEAIAASPMDGSRHRLRDIARAALKETDT